MRRVRSVLVLAVTLAAAGTARAGVTIHYDGVLKAEADRAAVIAGATAFARARGWAVEARREGVVLRPHAACEPVALLFDGTALAKSWVKTQFAGPEVHIAVVELFRSVEKRFERLRVSDEGEYWESADREKLIRRMQSDGAMMLRIKDQQPGTVGPFVHSEGRIVDLAQASPGHEAEALAQLKAAGARPLDVPLMPPRPWRPELKPFASVPAERWTRFEARKHGFAVTLPGPATEIETGVRAKADALYAVMMMGPFEDPRERRDLPAAFVKAEVGNILSYRTGTHAGLPSLTLTTTKDGAVFQQRFVFADDRAWGITVASRAGWPAQADVDRFLDSFEVIR